MPMLITEGILVSCTEERTVVVAHLCAAGLRDSKKHNVNKSIVLAFADLEGADMHSFVIWEIDGFAKRPG